MVGNGNTLTIGTEEYYIFVVLIDVVLCTSMLVSLQRRLIFSARDNIVAWLPTLQGLPVLLLLLH